MLKYNCVLIRKFSFLQTRSLSKYEEDCAQKKDLYLKKKCRASRVKHSLRCIHLKFQLEIHYVELVK